MTKVTRKKKFWRVVKRKLFKPIAYAVGLSFFLYLVIGNVVMQRKVVEEQAPRFLITRISKTFDETEFMHLLLTAQEILKMPKASSQLVDFVNGPFPGKCPPYLKQQLNRMNWEPQAFLVRFQKLFEMYQVYDRIARLDDTISFLSTEVEEGRLPYAINYQIEVLKKERATIIGKDISQEEFDFVSEYHGLVLRLKRE